MSLPPPLPSPHPWRRRQPPKKWPRKPKPGNETKEAKSPFAKPRKAPALKKKSEGWTDDQWHRDFLRRKLSRRSGRDGGGAAGEEGGGGARAPARVSRVYRGQQREPREYISGVVRLFLRSAGRPIGNKAAKAALADVASIEKTHASITQCLTKVFSTLLFRDKKTDERVPCAPLLVRSSPPFPFMPPRKLTRHSTPESKMAAEDLGNLEWERSKISQQDVNMLKKLGISGKQDALRFPKEESYPAPPMQYRPNWSLWKRIFLSRRNGSSSVAYNIGGIVICVRPDVEYFDVKFPDSVQGWRKKWLYIREENHGSVEDNIPPFDGAEKICRRRSWDAEATDAEKATEALMTRIHELQNTRGQELSGIQITAYFLRIRVQPLQARKNPLWMYAGDKDVDRLSADLSVNDLAKLVRKISSLNKKDNVPTSCGVTPYSATNAGGEVEERVVVTDDNQGVSRPESEADLRHPLKRTLRPRQHRRHALLLQLLLLGANGRGTRLLTPAPPKPVLPVPKKLCLMLPFMKELIRFGTQFIGYRDYAAKLEEKLAEANKRANALSAELEQSKTARIKAEADAAAVEDLQKRLDDAKNALSENVAQHSAREEEILSRLESQSRRFVRRTNQEYELESPEGDQLLDALSLLEIHGTEARDGLAEARIGLSRLFPYFFKKKEEPAIFIDLAKCFSSQEDLGLQLRQEGLKVGVEGTIALVAESQQNVDWARVGDAEEIETKKWQSLIKAAKPNSKKILATLGYKPAPAPSSSKPEVK
ncbi:hypothetical protein QYE76_063124 [Lolium multiflorum]|uniref:Uncharacterized protein n=1 Tax=Lolium multiflorum TaxID=4521 RepID=A0AAD8W8R8_LOLMU|nr:hypothetical protein QYE76_063124 [Lolium multiflorum]